MAVCRTTEDSVSRNDTWISSSLTLFGDTVMSKRYALLKSKIPAIGGGFVEYFRMGLADIGSLGDQYFDLAGYPYESEAQALEDDWHRLTNDFSVAVEKLESQK